MAGRAPAASGAPHWIPLVLAAVLTLLAGVAPLVLWHRHLVARHTADANEQAACSL